MLPTTRRESSSNQLETVYPRRCAREAWVDGHKKIASVNKRFGTGNHFEAENALCASPEGECSLSCGHANELADLGRYSLSSHLGWMMHD